MLTAAVTLYADRGHAQVSLDDVARAANVTRGARYHHYGSRTGLFAAVAEHVQSQVSQAVVAAAVGAVTTPSPDYGQAATPFSMPSPHPESSRFCWSTHRP